MEKLKKSLYKEYKEYPIKILQFGAGNFMRGFADWMIDVLNKEAGFNAGVAVVQPIESGPGNLINAQDGLYTLYLQGLRDGKVLQEHSIINSIRFSVNPYTDYDGYLKLAECETLRFVFSNTTEAGIIFRAEDKLEDRPPVSFPAKLAVFLYRRFLHFKGDAEKGCIIIPCELIDRNGEKLKEIILRCSGIWELGSAFENWLNSANIFCNSLVDRIVSGYPGDADAIQKELGYEDRLLDVGEPYHLWVIEGSAWLKKEFPAAKAGLNVLFVNDLAPYRTRKVRILNGAHTALVPVAYLMGLDTVGEAVEDETAGRFLREAIDREIIPTLELPRQELVTFAETVLERFKNPFVSHKLLSIALNSVSKYKTRVLPSVLDYVKRENMLPEKLIFALAALIAFYKGKRGNEMIPLQDERAVLEHFAGAWGCCGGSKEELRDIVEKTLAKKEFWDMDLTGVEGLTEAVTDYLYAIENRGMAEAVRQVLK